MRQDVVLGLDGGGTKTDALVLDRGGVVHGRGHGGPCNIAAVPVAIALMSVRNAAESALAAAGAGWGDVKAVCAGIAGYSHGDRRRQFQTGLQILCPGAQIAVEPDYVVALAGATEGSPGVIVIAGTGSAAYGENASGASHRAGAYGYLIDDAGSGYGVGRSALAAVLAAQDGTAGPTSLTERVLTALDLSSHTEIVPGVYGGALDRLTIASLAPLVALAAHEDHDPVAQAILMRTGGALARLAEAVCVRLFPHAETVFPVAAIGGLWNAGSPLQDVFARSLARFAPAAVLAPVRLPPAHGAALRALNALPH